MREGGLEKPVLERGDQRKKTTGEATLEVPEDRTFATGCNVMDVLGVGRTVQVSDTR